MHVIALVLPVLAPLLLASRVKAGKYLKDGRCVDDCTPGHAPKPYTTVRLVPSGTNPLLGRLEVREPAPPRCSSVDVASMAGTGGYFRTSEVT